MMFSDISFVGGVRIVGFTRRCCLRLGFHYGFGVVSGTFSLSVLCCFVFGRAIALFTVR